MKLQNITKHFGLGDVVYWILFLFLLGFEGWGTWHFYNLGVKESNLYKAERKPLLELTQTKVDSSKKAAETLDELVERTQEID